MATYLHVGGLVAAGFDSTGMYLITVSHSGRGVFAVDTWQRVARDDDPAYPEGGCVTGIGPIAGMSIPVVEKNNETNELGFTSPDGRYRLDYDDGVITVSDP